MENVSNSVNIIKNKSEKLRNLFNEISINTNSGMQLECKFENLFVSYIEAMDRYPEHINILVRYLDKHNNSRSTTVHIYITENDELYVCEYKNMGDYINKERILEILNKCSNLNCQELETLRNTKGTYLLHKGIYTTLDKVSAIGAVLAILSIEELDTDRLPPLFMR